MNALNRVRRNFAKIPAATPEPAAAPDMRGQTTDKKLFGLAFVCDAVFVSGSLGAAWVFAQRYAPDVSTQTIAMLGASIFAVMECSRLPIALAMQSHPNKLKRLIAASALCATTAITTVNIVPIVDMMWEPRLAEVRAKETKVAFAEQEKISFQERKAAALDEQARAKAISADSQKRLEAASEGLGKLPAHVCVRLHSTDLHKTCYPDTRTKVMAEALTGSESAALESQKALAAASARVSALDATAFDNALTKAKAELREAKQTSPLHLLYGSLTGTRIADISDLDLALALRLVIGLPALLAGCVSTAICILAVKPAKARAVEVAASVRPSEADASIVELPLPKTPNAPAAAPLCEVCGLTNCATPVHSDRENIPTPSPAPHAPIVEPPLASKREAPAPAALAAQKQDVKPVYKHAWDAWDFPNGEWPQQSIWATYHPDCELGLTDAAVTDQFGGASVVTKPDPAPSPRRERAKTAKANPPPKPTPAKKSATRRKTPAPARATPAPS